MGKQEWIRKKSKREQNMKKCKQNNKTGDRIYGKLSTHTFPAFITSLSQLLNPAWTRGHVNTINTNGQATRSVVPRRSTYHGAIATRRGRCSTPRGPTNIPHALRGLNPLWLRHFAANDPTNKYHKSLLVYSR